MVNTFSFNPMFLIHICALLQTIYLGFLILIPDKFTPAGKTKDVIYKVFKGLGLGTIVVFGIIYVDTALLWLFGTWSMADWQFQLPSVIILLYLGLGYIMVSLFSRGNVLDIVFCGAATTSVLVFLHWWVPIDAVMGARLEGGLPILIGVLVGVYVLISLFKKTNGQKKEKIEKGSNPLWDIRTQARYVFNRKIHLIFWILAVVQSMLAFYGYSILTFWAS